MPVNDCLQSRSALSDPVQDSLLARIGPVPCPKCAVNLAGDPINE